MMYVPGIIVAIAVIVVLMWAAEMFDV